MNHKPTVITGHPYAFPYYFKVFEYLDKKDDLVFVLPKLWLVKKGKVRIELKPKPGFAIYGLKAVSYGGHGLNGLFKGFLPGIIFLLPYLKLKHKSHILYSCSEPNILTTLLNGLTAKMLGMKYVFFTWQNVPPVKYMSGLKLKLHTALVKFNLYLADGVICGNRKSENIINEFNPKIKTIICPLSGVDTEKFKPGLQSDWKQKLNMKPEERIILFYGALEKRKGIEVLVDAFQVLNTKYDTQNTKLVVVGTGPEQESLRFKVKSLDLQDKVIFLDWMPNEELPALLSVSDVFVYPSVPSGGWEEQFGYAMAEASASGVPVVATRTGSIGEVIKDGGTGILVPPKDPEALANAVRKVLIEEDLGSALGRSGREYIKNTFSHNLVASKISAFLISF